ncbi:hypothetical protein NDI43_22430 [Microcoleus vaginatus GB2-A3]|uniref:hypothetical protein n=1 Tax=Microcoleus vaginatus TaxID=119532 RepID=UPI0032ADEBE6
MSTEKDLWKATSCYFGERVEEGRVLAIATYVDRRRICFLLNGKTIGQWVAEESLYGSVSSFKVEKEAQKEAKDDVNTLIEIVKEHKQIVETQSVNIPDISFFLETIISGLEFGAKLVVEPLSFSYKVVISNLLGALPLVIAVKDKILKEVNEIWSRAWQERVFTTLIQGEKLHYSSSKKIVDQLRIDYPDETNHQLAERIVLEKAVYTSMTGFIQGLMRSCAGKLPEAISDFIAGKKGFETLHQLLNSRFVNFFDTNSLLVEMIYQISLIYGMESGEGDILVILNAVFTKQSADLLEMAFLISSPHVIISLLVTPVINMSVFMLVGRMAIDCYKAKKETGKMPIDSLEALLSLQNQAFAYLTETLSKGPELEQALANAISVEAVAVPQLFSATS